MYLYDLPPIRKNVPELIKDPVELIKDVRSLVERHCKDQPELAVTGRPILHSDLNRGDNFVLSSQLQMDEEATDVAGDNHGELAGVIDDPETAANDRSFVSPQMVTNKGTNKPCKKNGTSPAGHANGQSGEKANGVNTPRRRRRRCKTCAPCNSSECGHCAFCLDMVS